MQYTISCSIVVMLATAFGQNFTNNEDQNEPTLVSECTNKTFIIYKNEMNWARADLECYTIGSRFASIRSQQEQDSIINARVQAGILTGEIWVSGYDATMTQKFKWMDPPVVEFDYTNWEGGKPRSGTENQCVFLDDASFWVNDECIPNRMYACEICS